MPQTDETFVMTQNICGSEEATKTKMKQIHPKLFGLICPVKYELISTEIVYVPYLFFVFDYRLLRDKKKKQNGKIGSFDREGEIGVVYDLNERHAFHFDLYDDLKLVKQNKEKAKGKFIPYECTVREAVDESIECVKWQYLQKVFHAVPDITLFSQTLFYRKAVQLNLKCKGKDYIKFAYTDSFAAKNEHISGLRVRLNV